VIQSRRSSPVKEEDVLQQFCDARYNNVYNGRQLTEEEIAGLLIAVLFAGQHTSSITSSWTGYFMINDKVGGPELGLGKVWARAAAPCLLCRLQAVVAWFVYGQLNGLTNKQLQQLPRHCIWECSMPTHAMFCCTIVTCDTGVWGKCCTEALT
jgi:hypothetical protein